MLRLRSVLLLLGVTSTATFRALPVGAPSAAAISTRHAASAMILGLPVPPANPFSLLPGQSARPEVLREGATSVDFLLETQGLAKRRVSGGVLVPAAPDAVWSVLTDYEAMPEVIPNILSNDVTRQNNRVTIQQESLLSTRLQLKVDMQLEAIEHRDRMQLQLSRLSGHGFLEFEATYTLQPRADGSTYLAYEVTLVPCPIFPLPLVERKMRKEVPKMLAAVAKASTA